MEVSIRKLRIEDAAVSYKWRNDPEVWELTGRKWNNTVTHELERHWIDEVNKRINERRFAICVEDKNEYIGNVQLTDITEIEAKFHIFIGNKSYWGKGIATKATELIINYAKNELELKKINLLVKRNNIAAIKVYEKVGFFVQEVVDENYLMTLYL